LKRGKRMNLQRMMYFLRGGFIFGGHGRVENEDWSSGILSNSRNEKPDILLYFIIEWIIKLL